MESICPSFNAAPRSRHSAFANTSALPAVKNADDCAKMASPAMPTIVSTPEATLAGSDDDGEEDVDGGDDGEADDDAAI